MIVKATIVPKPKVKKAPKPKRIWDNYEEVGEIQKSDRLKFIVAVGVRDGVKYLNIREFYLKKSEGIWKPGRDGISLPIKLPINKGTEIIMPYEGFRDLLAKAAEFSESIALYDEANALYYTPKEKTNED